MDTTAPCRGIWVWFCILPLTASTSPYSSSAARAWYLNAGGSLDYNNCTNTYGARPALVDRPDRVGTRRKPRHHTRKGAIPSPKGQTHCTDARPLARSAGGPPNGYHLAPAGRHGASMTRCKGGGSHSYDIRGNLYISRAV
nr:MAG TPA: hypothetical protein [Caudoviricetes sp.]